MSSNAPEKGSFVHFNIEPQAGHEQAGVCSGLVLLPRVFNAATGFAFVVPITGQIKGYPFEVVVFSGERCYGAVLVDQTKSLDWKARGIKAVGKASSDLID